ncbi:hypothetical protein [Jiulongibacter sp. NS-SX5]|uniref:hypothetical protein n=1 Tax=Jiulongibacter sp. NS-SX5 TaxID=3463854 RepID=UPI0040599E9F
MRETLSKLGAIACLVVSCNFAMAQGVGIGTTTPNESAVLDLQSSNKGLLIPRMSLSEREAIPSPAEGLIVYQMDDKAGFYFYSKGFWQPLSANSVAADPNDWTMSGNAALSGAFIGTTNNIPLLIKTNNVNSGYIEPGNRLNNFYGYRSGESNIAPASTGIQNAAFGYSSLSSNTTGSNNLAIGAYALQNNNANWNTAFGSFALRANTSGTYNSAFGSNALLNNTTGSYNLAIGLNTMYSNDIGSRNISLGVNAAYDNKGNDNVSIGYEAGRNKNGSGSVYIGSGAGKGASLTAESNKLYIANSSTTTPLIYGNFSAKFVSIGDVDPAKREAANTSGGYNLLVKGGILTEKVKVALASSADWADYVFEPSYKLMPLEEVESFTQENKHLPNVPSADEIAVGGLDVSATSKIFMEKIEELTLYMIELNKEVKALKAENEILKNKIN